MVVIGSSREAAAGEAEGMGYRHEPGPIEAP